MLINILDYLNNYYNYTCTTAHLYPIWKVQCIPISKIKYMPAYVCKCKTTDRYKRMYIQYCSPSDLNTTRAGNIVWTLVNFHSIKGEGHSNECMSGPTDRALLL